MNILISLSSRQQCLKYVLIKINNIYKSMLVVTQFGINATKENLIRFVQISEREVFESLWIL